jgi:hypothetical protein
MIDLERLTPTKSKLHTRTTRTMTDITMLMLMLLRRLFKLFYFLRIRRIREPTTAEKRSLEQRRVCQSYELT